MSLQDLNIASLARFRRGQAVPVMRGPEQPREPETLTETVDWMRDHEWIEKDGKKRIRIAYRLLLLRWLARRKQLGEHTR